MRRRCCVQLVLVLFLCVYSPSISSDEAPVPPHVSIETPLQGESFGQQRLLLRFSVSSERSALARIVADGNVLETLPAYTGSDGVEVYLPCNGEHIVGVKLIVDDNVVSEDHRTVLVSVPASVQPTWCSSFATGSSVQGVNIASACVESVDCSGAMVCSDGYCAEGTLVGSPNGSSSWPFSRTLVVNMPASKKRWRRVETQMQKFSIPSYERWEATNGSALNSLDLQSLIDNGIIDPYMDTLHGDIKRGVIGCALSHLYLLNDTANDAKVGDWTLVLEDDFIFPPRFRELLAGMWTQVPSTDLVDIVYVGVASYGRPPTRVLNRDVHVPKHTVGTQAYAVTRHGAKKLVEQLPPFTQSIDSTIHDRLLEGKGGSLKAYALSIPDLDRIKDMGVSESVALSVGAFFGRVPKKVGFRGLVPGLSWVDGTDSTIPHRQTKRSAEPVVLILKPHQNQVHTNGTMRIEVLEQGAILPDDGVLRVYINSKFVGVDINEMLGSIFMSELPIGPYEVQAQLFLDDGRIIKSGVIYCEMS